MIKDFEFTGSGRLLFGNGKISLLPSLADLNKAILICGNSFLKSPQYKIIKDCFFKQFTITGEPDPDTIDRIAGEVKGRIDSVIAVGGGSVLDAGKAIAAMCCSEGSVEEYLEGVGTKKPNGLTLPVIAVPTTAGTGSEATKNAVICRKGEEGYKKSLRHDNYIPGTIIIDPALYINCPNEIMSSCGMDAFSQLLESYISTGSNIYTDCLSWKGMTLFIDSFLELCRSNDKKLSQMGDIAFAAYLSGITLANAGLGTIHGIAGPMGGFYNIPHGTACGTLLPVVMKETINELYRTDNYLLLEKIEKLGRYIMGKNDIVKHDRIGLVISDMLENWSRELRIPRLSSYEIKESDAGKIAAASGNKNNPVIFSKEKIKEMIIHRI